MKVVSSAQMRDIEEKAAREFGVGTLIMMENAGAQSARLINESYPAQHLKVIVVCGSGNNGGDGFVVARHLINSGKKVVTYYIGEPKKIKGDALINWKILQAMGKPVAIISRETEIAGLAGELGGGDLIVDALLGTGIRGKVVGIYQKIIEILNSAEKTIIAIDTPSGLPVDRGVIDGSVIKAEMTVTMALPKIGFFHPHSIAHIGALKIADIGIPRSLFDELTPKVNLVEINDLPKPPGRPLNAHKGKGGRLLVIAGCSRYSGAAVLAGQAALNSGASYVNLAVPENIASVINTHLVEAVVEPLTDSGGGRVAYSNKERLLELAGRVDAVVLGPGLGQDDDLVRLVKELVAEIDRPLIIDADGLNILAKDIGILKKRRPATLLTPHAGELARLTGRSTAEISGERFQVVCEFATQYQVNLLLKGPRSLIANQGGELSIIPVGGPELATAGSGDVLAGLLGGVCARGLDLYEAAKFGCYCHGLSGKIALRELGIVKAGDIASYLPKAFGALSQK